MEKQGRNKFISIFIVMIAVFTAFYSCGDSYCARKKLVSELSSLFNENRMEFDKIYDYIYSDSISKRIEFRYQDGKIDIDDGHNSFKIDSINQISNSHDIFQILIFMKKAKIRIISGNPKESWIKIVFEDFKYPCFEFLYEPDFNTNDERTQELIQNIKNSKTKNWIYVLGDKWFIRGLKCF